MKTKPIALDQPLPPPTRPSENLPAPSDWSFELVDQYHRVIKATAERFGLDTYPNQLEIITAEQMMDAYASVGMPVNYRHWSYGKEFIATEKNYKRGHMGLAYEIVINSNPCISYLMEENTMAMQALVIAHAAYGHNSFFKGNYLFRMWTDAASIIDYLVYAKNYVSACEEKHGLDAVEGFIDSCHALSNHGVDRYRRPQKISLVEEELRRKDREAAKPSKPVDDDPQAQLPLRETPVPQIIDASQRRANDPHIPGTKPFERKQPTGHQFLSVTGFENYELPGFDLLDIDETIDAPEANREELLSTQRTIIETLQAFGIEVTAGDITRGPTITRYEIYPSTGLRVSRISQLEADIARATCAERINILAPIPGKDTVGIEIANLQKVAVPLHELLHDPEFRSAKKKIPLALGKDVYGKTVIGDLAAMPHCLVAGATGSGKSVCINSIIASMLFKFGPDELRFIMVDPKVVEMQMYNRLPHLVVPVVTDPKKTVAALKWVVNEMEKRYRIFAKIGVRNFDSFNSRPRPETPAAAEPEVLEPEILATEEELEAIALALESGELGPEADLDDEEIFEEKIPDRFPYIVVLIDELADLMQTAPADVEMCIARIAQKARAAGIHLIIATQTPRADVVTGIIKANIPCRIAFQVSSALDSRVILDTKGADKLVGKGDMLYLPPGSAKLERAQGAFVTDAESRGNRSSRPTSKPPSTALTMRMRMTMSPRPTRISS